MQVELDICEVQEDCRLNDIPGRIWRHSGHVPAVVQRHCLKWMMMLDAPKLNLDQDLLL